MPVLKLLLVLAAQGKEISLALEAVTALMEKARREGREVSREELEGLSLGAHGQLNSLKKALEE